MDHVDAVGSFAATSLSIGMRLVRKLDLVQTQALCGEILAKEVD